MVTLKTRDTPGVCTIVVVTLTGDTRSVRSRTGFLTRSGHPNGGGGWPRRPWNGRPVATPACASLPQPTRDSISTFRRDATWIPLVLWRLQVADLLCEPGTPASPQSLPPWAGPGCPQRGRVSGVQVKRPRRAISVGQKLRQPSPNGPNGRLTGTPESGHGAWRSIDERETCLRHGCRKSRRYLVHLGSERSRCSGHHAPF